MTLDPEVQAFAHVLREIEILLRDHSQLHWAAEIARCAASVERSDAYGLQRFLTLFGGMGSLNDMVFVSNGDLLAKENDRFHALLSRAYEAARRLERNEA